LQTANKDRGPAWELGEG